MILFTNQPNIQKLNQFVIIPTILQKPTPIFTQLKFKTNVFLVVTNVTIAEIFLRQERQKRHMENCSGVPGAIYNFNTQSLVSFEDSFHAKGDLPFAIYFDFETTAPTDNCFDPKQKTMFVASYVMIVAFHSELKLDKIIIQRSYVHAIEQLTSLKYFSQDQIRCINKDLAI